MALHSVIIYCKTHLTILPSLNISYLALEVFSQKNFEDFQLWSEDPPLEYHISSVDLQSLTSVLYLQVYNPI